MNDFASSSSPDSFSGDERLLALGSTPLTYRERFTAWWMRRQLGGTRAWERAIWRHASHPHLHQALCEAGVSAADCDRCLFQAFRLEDPRPLRSLLKAGADPDTLHDNGPYDRLLHRAAAHGAIGRVKLLLDHGADLEARDGNGYTALGTVLSGFKAVSSLGEGASPWTKRRAVANLLIERGAGVRGIYQQYDRLSMLGLCPLDQGMMRTLVNAGADPTALVNPTPSSGLAPAPMDRHLIFRAHAIQDPSELDSWLAWMEELGQGPQTPHCDGLTLPMVMMLGNMPAPWKVDAILDVLERRGFDLAARASNGDTIWHFCLWDGHYAPPGQPSVGLLWLKYLLDRPALIPLLTCLDSHGKTPLDRLRLMHPNASPLVQSLIDLLRSQTHRIDLSQALTPAEPTLRAPRVRL